MDSECGGEREGEGVRVAQLQTDPPRRPARGARKWARHNVHSTIRCRPRRTPSPPADFTLVCQEEIRCWDSTIPGISISASSVDSVFVLYIIFISELAYCVRTREISV